MKGFIFALVISLFASPVLAQDYAPADWDDIDPNTTEPIARADAVDAWDNLFTGAWTAQSDNDQARDVTWPEKLDEYETLLDEAVTLGHYTSVQANNLLNGHDVWFANVYEPKEDEAEAHASGAKSKMDDGDNTWQMGVAYHTSAEGKWSTAESRYGDAKDDWDAAAALINNRCNEGGNLYDDIEDLDADLEELR